MSEYHSIDPVFVDLLRQGKLISAYDVTNSLMVFRTEKDREDFELYTMLGDLSIAVVNTRYKSMMSEEDFIKFLDVSEKTYKKVLRGDEISLKTYAKILSKIGMCADLHERSAVTKGTMALHDGCWCQVMDLKTDGENVEYKLCDREGWIPSSQIDDFRIRD